MGQISIYRQYYILRLSTILLLFRHLCHNIVSNVLQSYLFYFIGILIPQNLGLDSKIILNCS